MTRSRLAAALAALLVAAGALVAAGCGGDAPPPETVETAPPPLQDMTVIFPEGFTVEEMARRIDAVRRIAIARRGVTPVLTAARYRRAARELVPPKQFLVDWKRGRIEGFLFPSSYGFTQVTSARNLVRRQLAEFRRAFATVDLRYARSRNLTPYDILKIASMIEKEVAVPSERRLVAAVIYNRLKARMPLQIDATVRYGLNIPPTESLTKAALNSDNPYNSRIIPGLPPTPIANPGLASLRAAADPADVPYLYYARIPGTVKHFFTADRFEFDRKVCEYGYGCP